MNEFTNPLLEVANKASVDPFLLTRSGVEFRYARFSMDDIYLKDIADHLSCVNRWVGAIGPLSVAQHSVMLARHALDADPGQFPDPLRDQLKGFQRTVRGDEILIEADNQTYLAFTYERHLRNAFAKALLMHDAEEYITNDIPGPLKMFLPVIEDYGNYIRRMIWRKYQIHDEWYSHCKLWDRRILFNEAEWAGRNRKAVTPKLGEGIIPTLDLEIGNHWRPEEASRAFLDIFTRLI